MYRSSIIPFYLAYPNYPMYFDEYRRVQDLEYLQEMYPSTVKVYQKKINQVLDRIDYKGSMIYDEYPDRISLYKLASDITQMILSENKQNNIEDGVPLNPMDSEEMDADHVGVIVQILLYYEIYKRRYKSGDTFLKF